MSILYIVLKHHVLEDLSEKAPLLIHPFRKVEKKTNILYCTYYSSLQMYSNNISHSPLCYRSSQTEAFCRLLSFSVVHNTQEWTWYHSINSRKHRDYYTEGDKPEWSFPRFKVTSLKPFITFPLSKMELVSRSTINTPDNVGNLQFVYLSLSIYCCISLRPIWAHTNEFTVDWNSLLITVLSWLNWVSVTYGIK